MARRLLNIPLNKKELISLKEDSFVWFSFLISLSLIFLIFLLIFLNWRRLPPEVPLFFSRPWGEKQLTSSFNLWLMPLLSFTVLAFNLFLAVSFFQKEVLIRRILASATLMVALICFLTAYKIILLIT